MQHLRVPWQRALAAGNKASSLVLVGSYDETRPEVTPTLAVMTCEKAARHLAEVGSRGLADEMRAVQERELLTKFSENERFGITALITAIAIVDGGSSIQFAEGMSSSSIQGTA